MIMRLPALIILACLLLTCLVEAKREYRRNYYGRNRHAKQVHRYVNSPLDCEMHERFERCGPELHCETTCENMLNPPNCQTDYKNPKCYFPRCVCEQGYVRHHGRCVLESYCKRHSFHH